MIAVGTRIPGTAKHSLFGRLQWRHGSWEAAVEASVLGRMSANDRGTTDAPGHFLMHLETAYAWRLHRGRLRGFARVENLFDRAYIGSIIVNEGNGRYYEPGPDRTFLIGAQWQWSP
ncbi:MAG: TonB-dependent receptor [Xanthomonadaceae bacterium]|jgi:iron complex outermembrane receptor protein|nr:TonB-dependent receptor [Xanthomonadaceae bacterium]